VSLKNAKSWILKAESDLKVAKDELATEDLFPPTEEAQEAVKLAENVKIFVLGLLAKEGVEL